MRAIGAMISVLLLLVPSAWAQETVSDYPKKPIKIIVSVPAGGGVDIAARIVAEGLRQKLGQPVIVENRNGASGNLGAGAVFTAAPDGYTLLAAQPAPLTINPLLFKTMSFDPTKFETVAIMSTAPNVLLVRPDFPAGNLQEFIAYAKAHPGKINYASQSFGTTSHLTAALFEQVADVKLVHVPYKGTPPALNDIVSGHVDMMFTELATAMSLHRAGKARILAVATGARIPSLPNIPTLEEAGLKRFKSASWNALAAPPHTPPEIIAKLNRTVNEVLQEPETHAHFARLHLTTMAGTPAQAATFIKKETQVWSDIVKQVGIEPR